MSHPVEIFADLIRYAVLCGVSLATGLAILRLLRVSLPHRSAVMIAPTVSLASWSVVLGFGVSVGVPVRLLAGPVWAVSISLAVYGIASHARQFARADAPLLALTAALPVCVMGPYFLFGLADYPGSPLADGWSYIAQGQYLWTYSKGAEGGLPPIYQYAAHLAHVRYVAGSMLGLFSPLLTPGDTQSSSGLFLTWALFVFSTSCAFFALSIGVLRRQLATYLVFVVASGWIANLVWANNYDNALALAFAPAFAGLLTQFQLNAWRWHVLLGLFGAGLFYVYPELAPTVTALAVFVALYRCRSERTALGQWILMAATSTTLALALTSPFLPDMVWFIGLQSSAGLQVGGRPGEGMFGGLLSLRFQPSAFWGLGAEFRDDRFLALGNMTGIALSILACLGCFRLLRTRQAGLAAWLVLLLTGSLAMILGAQYSYGAYKLILLSWWALGLAVVLGVDVVAAAWPRRAGAVRLTAWATLLVLALAQTGAHQVRSVANAGSWDMADYRRVRRIADLTDAKPILVAVNEPVASQWAVYFCRELSIALAQYRSYMAFPHVRPYLDRARSVRTNEIDYVLTDTLAESVLYDLRNWTMVWSSGPYRLWTSKTEAWSIIGDVTNPYGLERLGGKPFFWMGPDPTTVDVVNNRDGMLGIHATFVPGRGQLPGSTRRLRVTTDSGYQRDVLVAASRGVIRIPVREGKDRVLMTVLDSPTVPPADGDPRVLLLGVQDLHVAMVRQPFAIQHILNRNGTEELDGRPFFWMGAGDTVITIDAGEAGTAQLLAEFVPGPSVSTGIDRDVEIIPDGGERRRVRLGPGRASISVPLRLGENRVVLRALDKPNTTLTGAADRRPLVLGVRDLQLGLDESGKDAVTIERVENPNGLERMDGQEFFWIGGPATVITVRVQQSGVLRLAGRFVAGPSLSEPSTRRLMVAADGGDRRTLLLTPGDQVIRVAVPAGRSRVTLTALDEPRILEQPNGDRRPLLIGVRGLAARLEPASYPATTRKPVP